MFSKTILFSFFFFATTTFASLFPRKTTRLELHTLAEERRNVDTTPANLRADPFVLNQLPEGRRSLAEACEDDDIGACAFVSIFDDDVDIYSGCGGLADRKDEKWCYDSDLNQDICCGEAEDCCDVKVGALVGILIAFIAVLVASICGCCYCCKCCCLYSKFHGEESQAQPVATVTATPVGGMAMEK